MSSETVANDELKLIADEGTVVVCKPRRRRLSSYLRRRDCNVNLSPERTEEASVLPDKAPMLPDNAPIWLKKLLTDDLHTGRNMGVKLAYLRPNNMEDCS